MTPREAIEYYKTRGYHFINWDGIFYYNGLPCVDVTGYFQVGEPTEQINGYPAGNYTVYDNGYITGKTISGDVTLKIMDKDL